MHPSNAEAARRLFLVVHPLEYEVLLHLNGNQRSAFRESWQATNCSAGIEPPERARVARSWQGTMLVRSQDLEGLEWSAIEGGKTA